MTCDPPFENARVGRRQKRPQDKIQAHWLCTVPGQDSSGRRSEIQTVPSVELPDRGGIAIHTGTFLPCAGRLCGLTPRTCSNDDSNERNYRRTIRPTHSGRPASRIFWQMTGLLKPRSESPTTPTAGPRNFMAAVARRFCEDMERFYIEADCPFLK